MNKAKHLTFTKSYSVVKVKQGFCWPAFLFGSLWAVAQKMWFPYFWVLSVIDIGIWVLTGYAEANQNLGLISLALVLTIVYAVIRGRKGNGWHARSLLARGYTTSDASAN